VEQQHEAGLANMRTVSSIVLGLPLLIGALGCEQSRSDSASEWVGHAYLVTPADPYTYLTTPDDRTLTKQLAKFIPNFLLKVKSATADKVQLTLAPAVKQTKPPKQDGCNVTVEASATVSMYPRIQIGPMDLPLYVTNTPEGEAPLTARITVREFSLSDILPKGGTSSETGAFSALVDIREVAPLLLNMEGLTPPQICNVIKSNYTAECAPCPDSEFLCLLFQADDFGAVDADTDVKTVADSDLPPSCPKP
jgi:hypothetical protein